MKELQQDSKPEDWEEPRKGKLDQSAGGAASNPERA